LPGRGTITEKDTKIIEELEGGSVFKNIEKTAGYRNAAIFMKMKLRLKMFFIDHVLNYIQVKCEEY